MTRATAATTSNMVTTTEDASPTDLSSSGANRRERSRGLVALAILLLTVGAVWLWTANRDLPYVHHPDEPTNLKVVDDMVTARDPNPRFFHYPSLFLYLHGAVHLDGPLLDWLGAEEPLEIVNVGTARSPTPRSVSVHRALSVLFGLAAVAATYAAALRVTGKRTPAMLAAVLLATSVTLTASARFITPDALATALCATVLWAALRLWRNPTWGAFLLAGAGVGLATSAKYNAALVAVSVVAAALLNTGLRGAFLLRARQLAAAAVAAVTTFVLTTPYALLDRTAFLEDLRIEREHYAGGHAGMEGNAVGWYTEYLVTAELVLTLFALVGFALAVTTGRRRSALVVAAFPIAYGAFVATQAVRNPRTILVVLPFLAVLCAMGLDAARERRPVLSRPGAAALSAAALALVVIQAGQVLGALAMGPAAHQDTQRIGELELGESTWSRSRKWIDEHLPEGSSVLLEPYSPWVDPVRFDVQPAMSLAMVEDPHDVPWTYMIASEGVYGRYLDDRESYPALTEGYVRVFAGTDVVATFEGNGPTIRVLRTRPRSG